MRFSLKIVSWLTFCALFVSAASCGKDGGKVAVHPVKGQVFVNKRPAAKAFVAFHPAEDVAGKFVSPNAHVDEAGNFQLSTYGDKDGAPAGNYVVTVLWIGAEDDENRDNLPDKLQGRYSDPKTSPLKATVKPGSNTLPPFNLK